MKYLKEQGVPLEHTIRLYLGCSEERGMEDIEYYTSHYPAPEFSFTPDASFPVCYGEKGILEGEFSCAIPEGLSLIHICPGEHCLPGTENRDHGHDGPVGHPDSL